MARISFDDVMWIVGFTTSLLVGSIVWFYMGDLGLESRHRFIIAFLALVGCGFGWLFLGNEISLWNYRRKQSTEPQLVTLDMERSELEEISLADIENLHQYERINLGMNELTRIDLSPLTGSDCLRELILYYNRIEEIDLAPLASCQNLEYLDLTVNDLESIDLAPLSSCTSLTALNLAAMKLKELDLSPLKVCTELEILTLQDNELESLDITPLFECQKLTDFEIYRSELTTTLNREIEAWPEGVRKRSRKIRFLSA